MERLLLFMGFSFLAMLLLIGVSAWNKKAEFKSLAGLFLFGIIISLPFVMVEYLGHHLRFYVMVFAFVAIELAILMIERKVAYFHELIHHNVKELRIVSFFLIGLGFTYSEISFTIFNYHGSTSDLLDILPFKTIYAALMHTVFASAAGLIRMGNLFAETVYETVFKLFSYYFRISLIGISHFLYSFAIENGFIYLMLILSLIGMSAFFVLKRVVDVKIG